MCKVYTGYHGTSEIEHSLCACTVDNPLAKARGLSLRTGAQTMLYLSHKPSICTHLFDIEVGLHGYIRYSAAASNVVQDQSGQNQEREKDLHSICINTQH